jgi:DNA mismatch repair protein MutL
MPVRLLSETLANRIAAGEVVERPASIVKELVENALDAGARHVEIVAEGGGTRLIRIADDGHGMDAADLVLAVERFATSKIACTADLEAIATLGFRGEALPSIGAVARLAITSRRAGAAEALCLVVAHGAKGAVRPAAAGAGTLIEVTELFAHTPARLKFMKSERAEGQAVLDAVRRLALARSEIDFTLVLDGRRLRFPAAAGAADARQRLGQVLGQEAASAALPADAVRGAVRLTGLVGPPTLHRPTAAAQFFSVNARPVRDRLLGAALGAAYGDFLERGRYPLAALALELPPGEVDVNVHPAKAEVRFRDPGAIRALLVGGVREALGRAAPQPTAAGGARIVSMLGRTPPRFDRPAAWPASALRPDGFGESAQAAFALPPQADAVEAAPPESLALPLGAARVQLFDTYILAQTAERIVLVDMHAAHERLAYERLKRLRDGAGVPRQELLVPEVVELDPGALEDVLAAAPELARLGLAVEAFGPGAVLVRGTPSPLGPVDAAALVRDLAEALADGGRLPLAEKLDRFLSTVACHGSIRAGRRLKPEEMDALLRQIEAEPAAATCNHGRPTFLELSREDLERLFGRR